MLFFFFYFATIFISLVFDDFLLVFFCYSFKLFFLNIFLSLMFFHSLTSLFFSEKKKIIKYFVCLKINETKQKIKKKCLLNVNVFLICCSAVVLFNRRKSKILIIFVQFLFIFLVVKVKFHLSSFCLVCPRIRQWPNPSTQLLY